MQVSELSDLMPRDWNEEEPHSLWRKPECFIPTQPLQLTSPIPPGWENTTRDLVQELSNNVVEKWRETLKIEVLTKELLIIKNRIEHLEDTVSVVLPIDSLAPEPFQVVKTIKAVVRQSRGEYIATFYDASLSASGETDTEAVLNLKDMIVGTYEMLSNHGRGRLSPTLERQFDVLVSFIEKSD